MRSLLLAGLFCGLCGPALSTFVVSSVPTLAIAPIALTATSGSAAATTLAAVGLLKLKGAAILALASRNRREAESNAIAEKEDILFLSVLKLEEDKCVRRFLCEVATGKLVAPEYMTTVKPLISSSLDAQLDSAKFVFSEAAKSGARHTSIEKCQAKYSCPSTGAQIYSAAKNYGA